MPPDETTKHLGVAILIFFLEKHRPEPHVLPPHVDVLIPALDQVMPNDTKQTHQKERYFRWCTVENSCSSRFALLGE